MDVSLQQGKDGARCFLPTPPLLNTKKFAKRYGCDIAIPNGAGVGNVLMYTRTVDDLSRTYGRRLSILTAPINPAIGVVPGEDGFAIWRHNPHIERIENADKIDPAVMEMINAEQDNLAQFGHVIENIAYHYRIQPRHRRPSLYLTSGECARAIERLHHLPRPVICIHPHSTSGPTRGYPWHVSNWRRLIDRLTSFASIFEVKLHGIDDKALGVPSFPTKLRDMFALVWASDVVVCFDSLIAHVATALERPTIVLWDPTRKVAIEEKWQHGFALAVQSRWAYPQNDNIMLLSGREGGIVDIIARRARDRIRSFEI